MKQLLDQKVRELLRARRGSWGEIAIGADVSHSWISKFVNGHIPNPGYAMLRRLAEHLEELPAVSNQVHRLDGPDCEAAHA